MNRGSDNPIIRAILIAIVAFAVALTSLAQDLDSLPLYKPAQTVSGTIRIWGNHSMQTITKHWQESFRRYHPNVSFETNLMGTGTAMAGLYTGVADLAFMGRPSTPKEIMAFEWVFRYKPLALEITTGSLDVPGKSPALAVFVHKDNPITRLTLAQLDAILDCEHRRGLQNIRTWGQLGLNGEWADQPINAYGYDAETGTGSFFREAVLNGSYKWNWENVKEFRDITRSDGEVYDSSQQIVDALAKDRYGIGVSSLRYTTPQLKSVALASHEGEPYYQATSQNLIQRRYPLTRGVYVYIKREPGKPVDPKLKEFILYILSREGQSEVLRDTGFLPLSRQVVLEQLKKLK